MTAKMRCQNGFLPQLQHQNNPKSSPETIYSADSPTNPKSTITMTSEWPVDKVRQLISRRLLPTE